MRKPAKKRAYDASGRRKKAEQGRELVLEAARRLFAERGYVATTMEAIAEAASVAVPTLYAGFGSKRGVLSELVGRLVSGQPGGPSVLRTAGAQEVFAEPDARRALRRFAVHMNEIQGRIGPMHEVMKSAAAVDPEAAELFARTQRNRFVNLELLAARIAERAPLREGLSVEEAGRTIWVLASQEVRKMLLAQAGWTEERYAHWLGETLVASLLRDG